ncbi:alkyl sulfatase dimerization domain-containing protein [Pedobacter sp. R-06]|uniref:alkyl sulfatase dimerization domain-containing protein n=1 Tax=Pedobacter sp. R-06 TaxID=3404051 RepID=UPI003CF0681F
MKNKSSQIKLILKGLFCLFVMININTNIGSAQVYPGFENPSDFHHQKLERKRVELAPGVYAFVGYNGSNFGVIVTKNGFILIDTGDDIRGGKEALEEIKKLAPDSLLGIILTHSHPDHRRGANAFLQGRKGTIPVWGHYNFGAEQKSTVGLEKVVAQRASKQFGIGIPDSIYPLNSMIPRFPKGETGPLISPNRFVNEGKTELTIDGIKLELYTIPGESADHVVTWLPEKQVLFSGDHVVGAFPNLYPIRGGTYRDIEQWGKSVRRLMEFNPQAIMFGHNNAIVGSDKIMPMLRNHAEAIEYVYSETIKGMNEGKTPDQLAAEIHLPSQLAKEPYLAELYGAIPWAVRSIYAAKLGWFDGNPTDLVPLTPIEDAERHAKLAGGKAKMLSAAKQALKEQDYRWAAKLADYMLLLGEEREGKQIKASALEGISRNILPVTGKNYLIRSAIDLRKSP